MFSGAMALLFSLALGTDWVVAQEDPASIIKAATDELFAATNANREVIEQDGGFARQLVRTILTPRFDLERTCRWVLGKHWRAATPSQREVLIEQFRTLLVGTYARAVTQLASLELEYLPVRHAEGSNSATVRIHVSKDGISPVLVAYRLYNGDEGWKIFDVMVDGVSLVTTYRASFLAEISAGGIEGLIGRLDEKNGETGEG